MPPVARVRQHERRRRRTYREETAASDHGKWWIADDRLCQRWPSWMDGKSYCYRLTQTGTSLRWVRSDGASGTARIGG